MPETLLQNTWTIDEKNSVGRQISIVTEGRAVAYVPNTEEGKKIAKMIVAAPDLLAALGTCYNLFEAEYEDLSDQGKRARLQAMNAILKATE